MALSITCPYDAQLAFHAKILGSQRGSLEVVVQTFLRNHAISEAAVRQRAARESTTITNAVRRYVVEKYPDMAELWPERRLTANQVLGIARRSKNPNDVDEHKRTLQILASLTADPHNRRTRNTARNHLDRYGVKLPDLVDD